MNPVPKKKFLMNNLLDAGFTENHNQNLFLQQHIARAANQTNARLYIQSNSVHKMDANPTVIAWSMVHPTISPNKCPQNR